MLTRDVVLQALRDPNPNPIADQVAGTITRYQQAFLEACQLRERVLLPTEALTLWAPQTVVEHVAAELAVRAIEEEVGG